MKGAIVLAWIKTSRNLFYENLVKEASKNKKTIILSLIRIIGFLLNKLGIVPMYSDCLHSRPFQS